MKRLLALLLLASPLFGGWNYYRSITVNSGQISGTLSNYPMVVGGTQSYLATVANGGLVTNANGYDIAFFSDSGLTMPLACEQEYYVASSGAAVYWVNVPSAAAGSVFYEAYGNSSVSTAQCTTSGVWDSNFGLVTHFSDQGGSLSLTDSTGNNTITNNGATTAAGSSGKCPVDGCADFVHASSQYMTAPNTSSLELGTNMTLEMWLYVNGQCGSAGTCNSWLDKRNLSGSGHGYFIGYNESSGGQNYVEFYLSGATTSCDNYTGIFSNNSVIYIVATYNGSQMSVYQNGTALTEEGGCNGTVAVGSTNDSSATLYIGARASATVTANGWMDEIRISNSVRSTAWITATYNNITAVYNNTGAFYTIGSQMSGPVSGVVANPSVFGIAVQ